MLNKLYNLEVIQINLKVLKELKAMLEIKKLHILKNIKIIFLAVLLTKLYILMMNLASQLFFTDEKMKSMNVLK